MADLRLRIEGCRPAFAPRASWVLETLAEGLGRSSAWTEDAADLVYAPSRPDEGVWIPADLGAQAFFDFMRSDRAKAHFEAQGFTVLNKPASGS